MILNEMMNNDEAYNLAKASLAATNDKTPNITSNEGLQAYKAGGGLDSPIKPPPTMVEVEPEEEEVVEEENVDNVEDNAEEVENANAEAKTSSNESDENFFSEDDGVQLTLFE